MSPNRCPSDARVDRSLPAPPRARLRIAAGALLCALASAAGGQTCEYAIEYGMNPSFHTWSSRGIVFADAMLRAKQFELFEDVSLGPAELLPRGVLGEGWPDPDRLAEGQEYGALLFGSMEGSIPDGRTQPYVLTWEGIGSCRLEGLFVMSEANRTTNRVEVTVDPTIANANTGLACRWTTLDAADPVRNIRVWLPGMEGTGAIFWPPYLDRVRQMNHGNGPSSWRTLDWTRVNDHGQTGQDAFVFTLGDRVTAASATQGTPRGVAVEYQVAFCNELGIDLHFQVPHRTNDMTEWDYLLFLFETFRTIRDGAPAVPGVNGGLPFDGLDPSLTVMLELSNEIWNPGFPVQKWMLDQALARGLTVHEQIASQIELVFDIADGIFAGDPRLKKYVGGSLNNPNYLSQVLAALRPGFHLDAVGPAAYFGPRTEVSDAWLEDFDTTTGECPNCPNADTIVAAAREQIEDLRPGLAAHRAIADGWVNPDGSSPRLVLYEGGQSFKSLFQPWAQSSLIAQRKPEMYSAYVDDLVPLLIEEGVDEVIWYSFMTDQTPDVLPPFGIWNDMNQTISLPVPEVYVHETAPKAAAIYRGPPLTVGCPLARTFVRTAPGNPLSFSATMPRLGGTLDLTLDLGTTGHPLGFVFSFGDPAQIPLSGGQTLLTYGPPVLGLSVTGFPLATTSVTIPGNPALAGRLFAVQGLHVGGGQGFVLTNALDMVLGR